ncbi:MAG TPA: ATP-binding protein, partial [Nitrososphaerales archaeon]|nr:ATP-binding protein [Nitrososphaerales archaeon]
MTLLTRFKEEVQKVRSAVEDFKANHVMASGAISKAIEYLPAPFDKFAGVIWDGLQKEDDGPDKMLEILNKIEQNSNESFDRIEADIKQILAASPTKKEIQELGEQIRSSNKSVLDVLGPKLDEILALSRTTVKTSQESLYVGKETLKEIKDLKDMVVAKALSSELKSRHSPFRRPLRRLDPVVFINRKECLEKISLFLDDPTTNLLYVFGLPGIGKSTLVRGAIELRRKGIPVVWVICEGLGAGQLLWEINDGLSLGVQTVLSREDVNLPEKIGAVLGTIRRPGIIVLDGVEVLLDANGRFEAQDTGDVMAALTQFEHKAKVLATTNRLPERASQGTAGVQTLEVRGLDEPSARELVRARAGTTFAKIDEISQSEAFARLEGHPLFIEMLASSLAELPPDQVRQGLLAATDIQEFMVNQVVGHLNEEELRVLRAGLVFRGAFAFDALSAVYRGLHEGVEPPLKAIQSLVRRAVLDVADEPQVA